MTIGDFHGMISKIIISTCCILGSKSNYSQGKIIQDTIMYGSEFQYSYNPYSKEYTPLDTLNGIFIAIDSMGCVIEMIESSYLLFGVDSSISMGYIRKRPDGSIHEHRSRQMSNNLTWSRYYKFSQSSVLIEYGYTHDDRYKHENVLIKYHETGHRMIYQSEVSYKDFLDVDGYQLFESAEYWPNGNIKERELSFDGDTFDFFSFSMDGWLELKGKHIKKMDELQVNASFLRDGRWTEYNGQGDLIRTLCYDMGIERPCP